MAVNAFFNNLLMKLLVFRRLEAEELTLRLTRQFNLTELLLELLDVIIKRIHEHLRVLRCHHDASVDLRLRNAGQDPREVDDEFRR